ncbi:MAG: 50S ribosomal protein L18 [Candidatus Pacebacteria bacterium]|nr:50S ribosomal protein L18 [Candidatus Paceibacterota bacterium]
MRKNNRSFLRRKARTRKKIRNSANRLRLSVFRSNKSIYAQIIDDQKGITLIAVCSRELDKPEGKASPDRESKMDQARLVGEILAKKALEKEIKQVVFDRGSFAYHGRVKALAEGARKAGLNF